MSDNFRARREQFRREFDESKKSIDRVGRLVRWGAIAVIVLSISLACAVIYVAAHFIAKFW